MMLPKSTSMVLPGYLSMVGVGGADLVGLWVSRFWRVRATQLEDTHGAEHHLHRVADILIWEDPLCLHLLWNPWSKQYFWQPLCSGWEECRKISKTRFIWASHFYTQAWWRGLAERWVLCFRYFLLKRRSEILKVPRKWCEIIRESNPSQWYVWDTCVDGGT